MATLGGAAYGRDCMCNDKDARTFCWSYRGDYVAYKAIAWSSTVTGGWESQYLYSSPYCHTTWPLDGPRQQ